MSRPVVPVANFDTQPFGATTADADPAKSLAVRQAVADLVDREEIADQVYKGTYTPLYSYVPAGLVAGLSSFRMGQALAGGKVFPLSGYVRMGDRVSEEGGADIPTDWARPRAF